MPKRTLAPALLLLGSLTLTTACATHEPTADSARSGGAPSRAPGTDTGDTVDLSKIKGIRIASDNSDDRSCKWATAYPDVPGANAMTAAMKKDVDKRVADFLGKEGDGPATLCGGLPTGAGAASAAELNISFSFLVASGDVLGVRLTTYQGPAAGDGLGTKTYWYDGKQKASDSALGLIADDSRSAFVAAVRKQLEKKEGTDPTVLDDPANRAAYLDDMAFTSDGGLEVDFDRSTVGVPAGGRYTVRLPTATVTPWLSDFGKRVQRQTLSPSTGLELGADSTPTMPVPTHTADGEDTTDCAKAKCIALTFDDGPAAPYTATLLTYLAKYNARATFFTTGQNVASHPDLVRAEAKAGHEIGNHSWNHPDLTRLTPAQIASQLDRTNAAIKSATGKEPTLFRPPYGATNGTVKAATALSPVMWDVDTEDWKYPDASRVAQYVISKAGGNDVVLLHDIHPTSVESVPEILRTLTARGYHFVTVSHLRATLRSGGK